MTPTIRFPFAAAVLWALMAPLALAQKGATPVVSSAVIDGATISITGVNFGTSPSVTLGSITLGNVVVNNLGTEIHASVPALAAGSYLLTVQSGNNKSAAFEITIGAIGPQGRQGRRGRDPRSLSCGCQPRVRTRRYRAVFPPRCFSP